jgi:alpha-beta hydrolase superfamily lysophospholipase
MAKSEHGFQVKDGLRIVYRKHIPESDIKAIVIIVHGMAEHADRYDNFAGFLNREGFVVYVHDQRGHGKTAGSIENVGFLSDQDGWRNITNDLAQMVEISKQDYPEKKIILLGHSMGSFVVRTYLAGNSEKVHAAILSGTTGSAGLMGKFGLFLIAIMLLFKKKNSPSPLMNKLSFGDFNKSFKPSRTEFDWLSRDHEVVDKYVADLYCGGIFSLGFFKDMMQGLEFVNKKETAALVRKDLPMYLFSGEKDPVSMNGKKVKEVYEMYKSSGIINIDMKMYPDARHETLNEINKEEVYSDVLSFLNRIL